MKNKIKYILGVTFLVFFITISVITVFNFFSGDSFKERLEKNGEVLTDDLKLVYSKGITEFRGGQSLKIYKYSDETDFFDQYFLSENIFLIKRNNEVERIFEMFKTDVFKIPDEYLWDFEKDEYSSFEAGNFNIIHFKNKKQVVMFHYE